MMRGHQSPELVVAEDSNTARNLLLLLAKQRGVRAAGAADGESAMKLIGHETKAVLLDLRMPGWDGFKSLEYMALNHPKIPTIILSAADQAAEAVRALKLGAVDYLTKPFDPEELFAVVFKAFDLYRMREENENLRDAVGESANTEDMVAVSPGMVALMSKARKIAPLDSSVLLTGNSGVGKGMLARMIHSLSGRSSRPFVTVSCPALPRELLESELFGHEKGAFTGAVKRRIGKIESAAGGTLFLDEIGDLPIDLQPKILNVLQDRQFQRVGGEKTIQADVRLIAATNIDFAAKIKEGSFREDLFYRLSVIPLEVPSLCDRRDEIGPLAEKILGNISQRRNCPQIRLSPEVFELFQKYDWPGNVRELENVLERCSAFCEEGEITLADLPPEFNQATSKGSSSSAGYLAGMPLEEVIRAAIEQTLELCQGNRAETARRLGISEKSVYNKLKAYANT
ncbi:sigma-54-dependent transcriptional regulator [Luteolibacter algae]|uniref:Sigma-54-dependent transcriptional regulator n=1 Tax=Luteolibacter algae TaxID=454151 RepID=A0ABW5D5C7_9BACT